MEHNKMTLWKNQLLMLIILATLSSGTAYGAVYYVKNSGSPACSNSVGYGTLSQPYCTISYAVSHMSGGDAIYVRSGTYNEELYITGPAGSAGATTTIAAYPGDTVTLFGNGINTGRCKIANTSYITFDGFKITNYNQGLYVENSNHITVQNIEIYTVGQEGLRVLSNSSFVTIQNSLIHDTRAWQYNGEGMYIGTRQDNTLNDNTNNVMIKNNTIFNTNDECIELKPGTHDCLIENNNLHDCARDSAWQADWGSVEIDEAVNSPEHWDSNPNHIIRNNIIHDTKTALQLGTGSTAYNNVIYNIASGFYGVYTRNFANDSYTRRIYNNTIDVTSSRAVYTSPAIVDVKNNIGPTTTNNISTNGAYYVNQSGRDYHLVAGVAPINAGFNLTATVPTDMDGVSRTAYGAPDIGAYEFSQGLQGKQPSAPYNLRTISTTAP